MPGNLENGVTYSTAPYLFATLPTCATGSFMRLIRAIIGPDVVMDKVSDRFYEAGDLVKMRQFVPPLKDSTVYIWNTPEYWNESIPTDKYRFILNFRDPRDLVCNQYYWALLHENPSLSPEQLAKYRDTVREQGIDSFVVNEHLTFDNRARFRGLMYIAEQLGSQNFVATTYAQICLRFDELVARLADAFQTAVTPELLAKLEPERPENLLANQQWQHATGWMAGADQRPGRYLSELKKETIERLELLYAEELRFCSAHEPPPLDRLYGAGRYTG